MKDPAAQAKEAIPGGGFVQGATTTSGTKKAAAKIAEMRLVGVKPAIIELDGGAPTVCPGAPHWSQRPMEIGGSAPGVTVMPGESKRVAVAAETKLAGAVPVMLGFDSGARTVYPGGPHRTPGRGEALEERACLPGWSRGNLGVPR